MYGLIHTALRQQIIEKFSLEQWNQILEKAELPKNAFLSTQSYDMLLSASGDCLFDFLDNLNSLHDRISTTFVEYGSPSFKLQRYSDSEGMLEYRSSRSGMEDRFDIQITIKSVEVTSTDAGDSALINIKVDH